MLIVHSASLPFLSSLGIAQASLALHSLLRKLQIANSASLHFLLSLGIAQASLALHSLLRKLLIAQSLRLLYKVPGQKLGGGSVFFAFFCRPLGLGGLGFDFGGIPCPCNGSRMVIMEAAVKSKYFPVFCKASFRDMSPVPFFIQLCLSM